MTIKTHDGLPPKLLEDIVLPQQDVITLLREMLEDAERGFIAAVAVAALHPGHHVSAKIAGYATPGLSGGVALLQYRLTKSWQDAADRSEVWA